MSFKLITIPCLSDNYAFVLYNLKNRSAFLVDAPEAGPINEVLHKNNLNQGIAAICNGGGGASSVHIKI